MRAACLNAIRDLAKRDQRVVFIGSDLSPALCKSETPDRWFMEGVAEQNMIGMAAGMALDGLIPYCNTIATFLTRRCYDQIAVDLCMHNLPVRLVANGGGCVYAPLGPTHLAIEDIAIMRALPNMTVVAPCDAVETIQLMEESVGWPGPMYIRLSKGGETTITDTADWPFVIGKARVLTKIDAPLVTLMSTGAMTANCLAAATQLAKEGIQCAVVHFPTIKPLDVCAVVKWAGEELTVVVEEGARSGGLGTAIAEAMRDAMFPLPPGRMINLGIDGFLSGYGTREDMWEKAGLMPHQIASLVKCYIKLGWINSSESPQRDGIDPRPQSLLPTQKRVLGGLSWVE